MRDGPHDRARRKQTPCKPQRGGHRGFERRVGRATTGATRQAPPPCRGTSAAPRACAVLATCLCQRTDSEDAPPPPPPSPPPTQERAEESEEMARGHGGEQGTDRCARERDGRRAVETKKKKEQRKPTCQGRKARRQGPKPRQTGGRPGRYGPARDAGEVPDIRSMGAPKEKPPPPTAAQCLTPYLRRACVVPATCVLRREDDKGAPPFPTHHRPPEGGG